MDQKSKLRKVIAKIDDPENEFNSEEVMDAYHQLNEMGEHLLEELMDDYALGKLDARRTKIFESHLHSCKNCKSQLKTMRLFIKGVKGLGNELH